MGTLAYFGPTCAAAGTQLVCIAIPQRGALGNRSQLALISSDPDSPQPSRVHARVQLGDRNRRRLLNARDFVNILTVSLIYLPLLLIPTYCTLF